MKSKDLTKWKIISNGVLSIFSLAAVLPFILLIMSSFTEEAVVMREGYRFWPRVFSLEAYRYIFTQAAIIGRGYMNTITVTVIGTGLSILLTSMLAYTLAESRIPGTRIMNYLCIFTMLFSGGMVSSYYIWSSVFYIRDTMWALILPNLLMNAFSVLLVKNYYINSIPPSLKEAARIDGCSEFRIFLTIVMPLSIPINATIGLMTGLVYWNDWVNGLYYLTQRNGSKYFTIQIILNQISDSITWLSKASSTGGGTAVTNFPSSTARMAIAAIGVLPIIIVYPFLQKYFVKGIMIGAVKE